MSTAYLCSGCVPEAPISKEQYDAQCGFCDACFAVYQKAWQDGFEDAKKVRASTKTTIRIDYDDHPEDVMDKVNKALKEHGLVLKEDDLEHDGFCIYTLESKETA